jgi:hypothetical protein
LTDEKRLKQAVFYLDESIYSRVLAFAMQAAGANVRRVNGRSVWVIIAIHNGREYLKTEADGYEPNNLLSLRSALKVSRATCCGRMERMEFGSTFGVGCAKFERTV